MLSSLLYLLIFELITYNLYSAEIFLNKVTEDNQCPAIYQIGIDYIPPEQVTAIQIEGYFPADLWEITSILPSDSVRLAGKDLQFSVYRGYIRILILGMNIEPIRPGKLCEIAFECIAPSGSGKEFVLTYVKISSPEGNPVEVVHNSQNDDDKKEEKDENRQEDETPKEGRDDLVSSGNKGEGSIIKPITPTRKPEIYENIMGNRMPSNVSTPKGKESTLPFYSGGYYIGDPDYYGRLEKSESFARKKEAKYPNRAREIVHRTSTSPYNSSSQKDSIPYTHFASPSVPVSPTQLPKSESLHHGKKLNQKSFPIRNYMKEPDKGAERTHGESPVEVENTLRKGNYEEFHIDEVNKGTYSTLASNSIFTSSTNRRVGEWENQINKKSMQKVPIEDTQTWTFIIISIIGSLLLLVLYAKHTELINQRSRKD